MLIYLNADFDSGATEFPNISLKLRPPVVPVGSAIVFYNWANESTCDPLVAHRGARVVRGEVFTLHLRKCAVLSAFQVLPPSA